MNRSEGRQTVLSVLAEAVEIHRPLFPQPIAKVDSLCYSVMVRNSQKGR